MMASYSEQKEMLNALFKGKSTISSSCSTLGPLSTDAGVPTNHAVVIIRVNNSILLYTDKVDSCPAILSGYVQPISIQPGLTAHYLALM